MTLGAVRAIIMYCYSSLLEKLLIRMFSMLSMKGLVSLKIDTDYNSCLLFESTKMSPEDLKKLGPKFLLLLFPTVKLSQPLIFLYLPVIFFLFFSHVSVPLVSGFLRDRSANCL